jgi:hypothetical protein
MDDPTTTATLDQADEDILTYTASDEALEAAAGTEMVSTGSAPPLMGDPFICCIWPDDNNTAIDAIQIDEEILSYTVSDEALEAAAGGYPDTETLASQTCNLVVYFCR